MAWGLIAVGYMNDALVTKVMCGRMEPVYVMNLARWVIFSIQIIPVILVI